MTATMGPPPPRNTTISDTSPPSSSSPSAPTKTLMGPPPPNPDLSNTDSELSPLQAHPLEVQPLLRDIPQPSEGVAEREGSGTDRSVAKSNEKEAQGASFVVPYTIPQWSDPPCHHYFMEVLKDGSIIDQFDVYKKGAYMFGRVDLCDFVLEHPTISRFHAVIQFKGSGEAYVFDLGSTHGTFINKNQVKKKVYVELHVGDVIRFGGSSRLYIFQGPPELMVPEKDLKRIRDAKIQDEKKDMEASILRAKRDSSLADGISWGMGEDAIEETEDDIEEITWQTYKGQLTEKQEKTREKVLKRLEKIANMKKEIDAIRVKDIAQGGLTQGQQTQIARNEQRISQIGEELENLEETLNESIRESMGARAGRTSHSKKKGATEDEEDEYISDDDEFYDRARKTASKQMSTENQTVETADSLLDKKNAITKALDEKRKLLLDEENKMASENAGAAEGGDSLDAFMSGLSSQLVLDRAEELKKELNTLQADLERVLHLLKIADPTGEASRKRECKPHEEKPKISKPLNPTQTRPPLQQSKELKTGENSSGIMQKTESADKNTTKSSNNPEKPEVVADAIDGKPSVYTVAKPQWLGAVETEEVKKHKQETTAIDEGSDEFIDYKDRKEALGKQENLKSDGECELENAAPGLIIRKRKQVEKSDATDSEQSKAVGVDIRAEDAVALLLKHSRGYPESDNSVRLGSIDESAKRGSKKGEKKSRKVLGPEKPSFLDGGKDYESWVPPEGQSGDGRTSLNDRFGY